MHASKFQILYIYVLTNLNNSPKQNNFHFFSQIFRNLLHAQNRIFWNDRKQFSKHSQTWDNKLRPKSRFCTPFALVFGCCQCDQIGVSLDYMWRIGGPNSITPEFLNFCSVFVRKNFGLLKLLS